MSDCIVYLLEYKYDQLWLGYKKKKIYFDVRIYVLFLK